ncbi:hypothetical protein DPMN_059437 [Dreissena polymorpha]|uniref:Uncharacterized protein n=1 Tax=Dreissena polymorpha TaxID=45954 RepID=A0A9D4C3Z6_DREPO|nr:hypothetical protein DPMN_059437 [Dreissena polymorpha]
MTLFYSDKIFVTNPFHHKVLTLATDGTVLHTFTDPDLQAPNGIHVTDLGQVLVCGYASRTIIQLDGEGKKKLTTLASKRDGLAYPEHSIHHCGTIFELSRGINGTNVLTKFHENQTINVASS